MLWVTDYYTDNGLPLVLSVVQRSKLPGAFVPYTCETLHKACIPEVSVTDIKGKGAG